MKNRLLLPFCMKWIGLALFVLFTALCIATYGYDFELAALHWTPPQRGFSASNDNLTDELALCGMVCSLLLVSFSRERHEDEYVNMIRLQSLQIAFALHYLMLMLIIVTVYGMSFLLVMVETIPVLLLTFLAIFYFRLKMLPVLLKRRSA